MSYQVNQRINPYPAQPSMGLNSASMQNVDAERLKQGVNETPVTKVSEHKDNPLLLLGSVIASFAGISWIMSKFNGASRGEYKDSVIGKMGNWGDKIGSKPFFQKEFFVKAAEKSDLTKKFLTEKVVNKSKILSALINTHSVPTNKMALIQANGISAELGSAATQMFEEFTSHGQDLEKIMKLGFVKNGQADVAHYQDVVKNSHKYVDEIAEACRKQGPDAFIAKAKGGKIPWTNIYLSEKIPFTKKIFCEKHYFSEFTNKIQASKGLANTAQATRLGKIVPRQSLRLIESITCANTGGGLIGVLMGSYFIADSIVRAIKAPKGEKGKTFAESMVYNASFYLTMPLAMKLMHGAGGLQYIGMNKEQVAEYRKNLEAFDAKAKASGFANKAEWKAEKTALKDALKGDTKILKTDAAGVKTMKFMKNLIYKPLKFAGSVITVGLETIRGYIPKESKGFANTMQKAFSKSTFKLKDIAGYPMRIGLFMFVIAPPLSKFFAKCSHVVFGKPTKSVLDEGKEEAPEKAALSASRVAGTAGALKEADIPKMQPMTKPVSAQMERNELPVNNEYKMGERQNLLDKYKSESAGLAAVSNQPAQTRRYIPSSDGVKIVDPNEAATKKAMKALDKADTAGQKASKAIGRD